MFIGHYKSVQTKSEFYSTPRLDLNFSTQVEYKGERYLLSRTVQVNSNSHLERIVSSVKNHGVECNVKID